MRLLVLILYIFVSLSAFSQLNDEQNIRQVLRNQTESWNQGKIEKFMEGYWQSDSLMFIGSSGVTRGWNTTLENYKKHYPDTAAMGKLSFDLVQVSRISAEYFYIVGKWHLKRSIGDLNGHFTLLFKKIKNKWLIVSDHSS